MTDDDARNDEIYSAYLQDIEEYGQARWARIKEALPHIELSERRMRYIASQKKQKLEREPPEELQEPLFNESELGAEASSYGTSITSLEELLEACNYYRDGLDKLWRVKRHVANVWESGDHQNWQVKAWFEPREEYSLEAAVEDIIARLESHVPKYDLVKALDRSGEYLFVPSLYDAHINKLSVDGEYTLDAAVKNYETAGRAMIARALSLDMDIRRTLFVIGQDALHIDNLIGTTTAGTWMDVAAGQRRAIDAVIRAVTYVIEQLAGIAPVDVVTVEGNHDRYSTYWLGKVVAAWFKNHPNVVVDAMYDDGSAAPRKYYKFGNNLLGLDHGQSVKPEQLALIMATESPRYWADTQYREFLRGHFHRRMNLYHQAIEEKGVTIRVLPALCPPDEWHVMRGFIGSKRAADALFYHYEHGPAGQFPVFIDELVDLK